MNTVIGSVSLCVATLLLSACATSGSGSATASKAAAAPAASGASTGAAAASTSNASKIPSSYTVVQKDGKELYCRKEKATGSRARTVDVCLTKAQLDAQATGVNSLLQHIQDSQAGQSTGGDSSGGRSNSITSQ